MSRSFALAARSLAATLSLAALGGIAAAQVTISPDSIDITLGPGEEYTEVKIVTIPGGDPSTAVDIYFLADTTGSMGSVIANVRANAAAVLADIAGDIPDVQFGVGEYKDFPADAFCFRNNQSITANLAAAQAGINLWAAGGGFDTPEGQFFALDQIADPADNFGIGFRPDAQKIIVWFGDAPAHDPVCAAISGLGYSIDEANLRAKLVANRFTVIALGTSTGPVNDLNGTTSLGDYGPACGVSTGAAGQATRIANDTGGVYLQNVAPAAISQAILDAIDVVISDVTVELVPAGDTAPYTTVLTPPYVDVPLPPAGEFLVLEFEVKFVTPTCDPDIDEHVFTGTVDCLVDGALAAQQDVTLRAPDCDEVPFCYTLDFSTEDDFVTALPNGAHVNTEFGTLVTLTSSGTNQGMCIFDSTVGGPNDPSQDRDLLVGSGNILILQTENYPPDVNDLFPRPNDDDDGGTLTFSFHSRVEATSVRLIDIDTTDLTSLVELTDIDGRRRTYSVPANWTGDRLLGQPGQGTLDLQTLAPQPGFGSVATAAEQPGFDATNVIRIAVSLGGSAGMDDLAVCSLDLPAGMVIVRNGSGANPSNLRPVSRPLIGGTWAVNLDCSHFQSGFARLAVRRQPSLGPTTGMGELLIRGGLLHAVSQPLTGEVSQLTWSIPYDMSLCGLEAYAQGLCRGRTGSGKAFAQATLSNALDLVIGF